jgi:hypothetical protein
MKHSIVFKQKDTYASFPLLKCINDDIYIGFFVSSIPDHCGIARWKILKYYELPDPNIELWAEEEIQNPACDWYWPAMSARERSDRFTIALPSKTYMIVGSFGFQSTKNKIIKSRFLYQSIFRGDPLNGDKWTLIDQKIHGIPHAKLILTFPRVLRTTRTTLIPTYAVFKGNKNKCFVLMSDNKNINWKLFNMFPDEINGNEMALIQTRSGILAHIRSDTHPYLMESWSDDGKTWTYPSYVTYYEKRPYNVVGGPPHLLRLKDNRILCTYGYRFEKMGIRAIVSENEGKTWTPPIILRDDGGFLSSLRMKSFKLHRKTHPGNDTGYPVSIQLNDESILTAYYITTEDRITHIATTKWKV